MYLFKKMLHLHESKFVVFKECHFCTGMFVLFLLALLSYLELSRAIFFYLQLSCLCKLFKSQITHNFIQMHIKSNIQNDVMLKSCTILLLSSARTSVRVKLGLFNAKICNENRCYIHRLIYQINEQDLLCHSI